MASGGKRHILEASVDDCVENTLRCLGVVPQTFGALKSVIQNVVHEFIFVVLPVPLAVKACVIFINLLSKTAPKPQA